MSGWRFFKEDKSSLLSGVQELQLAQELVSQSLGVPPHRKVWQLGKQYDLGSHQILPATPKIPNPLKPFRTLCCPFFPNCHSEPFGPTQFLTPFMGLVKMATSGTPM